MELQIEEKQIDNKIKRKIVISAIIAIVIYIIFIFVLTFVYVPNSYSTCKLVPFNNRNGVTCSILYTELRLGIQLDKCFLLGGVNPIDSDGPNGCHYTFFNPNFTFSSNYEECSRLNNTDSYQSSISRVLGVCTVFINISDDDKNISEVFKNCPSSYKKEIKYGRNICTRTFSIGIVNPVIILNRLFLGIVGNILYRNPEIDEYRSRFDIWRHIILGSCKE